VHGVLIICPSQPGANALLGLIRGLGHHACAVAAPPKPPLASDLVVLRPSPGPTEEPLCEQTLQLRPPRLLLVTGNGALVSAVRQRAHGWVDVLAEPCFPEDLAARVTGIIGPGSAATPMPATHADDAPQDGAYASLSRREREVLEHVASGATNAQIAQALGVQQSTIESHVGTILRKLDVQSRTEAVASALRRGWL
jgi:DNA-binding NarL/FixJ family response regulator